MWKDNHNRLITTDLVYVLGIHFNFNYELSNFDRNYDLGYFWDNK